jgi:hypothetical protein
MESISAKKNWKSGRPLFLRSMGFKNEPQKMIGDLINGSEWTVSKSISSDVLELVIAIVIDV